MHHILLLLLQLLSKSSFPLLLFCQKPAASPVSLPIYVEKLYGCPMHLWSGIFLMRYISSKEVLFTIFRWLNVQRHTEAVGLKSQVPIHFVEQYFNNNQLGGSSKLSSKAKEAGMPLSCFSKIHKSLNRKVPFNSR